MRVTWFALVAVLGGCHHRSWSVPPPDQAVTVPLDAYFAFRVQAVAGGIKPGVVQTFSSHCVDPSICEARAVPPGTAQFGEVHVIGKRVGTTKLVVDAVNPIYKDRESYTIDVSITAPRTAATLAVGAPLPAGSDVAHADIGHCAPSSGYFETLVTGGDRPDVHLYACSAYQDVDGERRYRSCGDRPCGSEDSYVLCTETHDGTVSGTAVLARADTSFEVKSTDGTLDEGVCTPRN